MSVQIDGSTGNIIAIKADYSGDVSIGGTLTYEDVTNIDAVGLITARNGIKVDDLGVQVGTGATVDSAGDNILTFLTGGSERVRVASGGDVGIGDNNPGEKLDVNGKIRSNHASDSRFLLRVNDVNKGGFQASTDNGVVIYGASSTNPIKFQTSGSEKARFDTSGQLGIGTTSPSNMLHLNGGSPAIRLSDTGANGSAFSIIEDNNGLLKLRNDAGNAGTGSGITFEVDASERMRVDSDGRLLVGASTARGNFYNSSGAETRFLVEGTTFTTSSAALVRNSNNASDAELVFAKSRGGSVGSNTVVQSGDNLGAVSFQGSDGAQFVEAASITAFVAGTPGSNDMPGYLSFAVTNDGASTTTERLRINNLGFLKAGPRITDGSHGVASLTSARHEFTSDNNGWTIIVTHTSGAASEHEGILIDYNNDPNGTGNSFLQGNANSNTRFRMASNGGLYNYQSNDSNLCDEREKKNIVSLDTKWDKVKSWELKKFHYNEDADSDDLRYGVIAQQVEGDCPELLTEWVKQEAKDAVLDGDGNIVTPAQAEVVRKGVKEQQMMWMAIKALQEAQTRIETLETQNTAQQTQINDLITRVTALEG